MLDLLLSKKTRRERLKRQLDETEDRLLEAYRSLELSRVKCHRMLYKDFYGPVLSSFREKKISLEYHIVVMDEVLRLEKQIKRMRQKLLE